MSESTNHAASPHVYRIDSFAVPSDARDDLLSRIRETHVLLCTLPDYVDDAILEQSDASGEVGHVTIVERESAREMADAGPPVHAMHQRAGFDPRALLQGLGVRVEFGCYQEAAS